MTRPQLMGEEPVAMFEMKEKLAAIKERDGELNFRATKTEEYVSQFLETDTKKLADLKEKLEKLAIPRMKSEHIVKIVDIMPSSANDLKVVLQGYPITISGESAKKIIETVNAARG